MSKLRRFAAQVGFVVIVLFTVSSIASFAPGASAQWDWLFGRRQPDVPLGTRGSICAIAPGALDANAKILSDRPLFSWKDKAVKLRVRDGQTELWQTALNPQDDHIVYAGQAPLQPGKRYFWEIVPASNSDQPSVVPTPTRTLFAILPQADRDRINADLNAIEQKNKSTHASAETIADAKANYLIEKRLWSDAVRVLYEVKNPSVAFTSQRQQFIDRLCVQQP